VAFPIRTVLFLRMQVQDFRVVIFDSLESYSAQIPAVFYCSIVVSAFGGFCGTCCGRGNCERSHPSPRACTSATAEVLGNWRLFRVCWSASTIVLGSLWRRCRRRNRSPIFVTIMLPLLHRLFQRFLAISKESMNLAMRFVADSVNLRSKLLPRCCRILIEQRLNLIVVLLKQRPDLVLLFRSQLQIFRKASQFLVD
jgi:hypothetical protein